MALRQESMPPTAERELVLSRTFDAPRDLVFRMWIDKEHFAQWCAPPMYSVVENDADPRPGGAWYSRMLDENGVECFVSGEYREVIEPERLVFSYAHKDERGGRGHETEVTVHFTEAGDKTTVTLYQSVFVTTKDRDNHQWGWSGCFERLNDYLNH